MTLFSFPPLDHSSIILLPYTLSFLSFLILTSLFTALVVHSAIISMKICRWSAWILVAASNMLLDRSKYILGTNAIAYVCRPTIASHAWISHPDNEPVANCWLQRLNTCCTACYLWIFTHIQIRPHILKPHKQVYPANMDLPDKCIDVGALDCTRVCMFLCEKTQKCAQLRVWLSG